MIFGDEWWCVICEEESRCIICGERNEMGVKCAFCVILLKLVFFWIFENEFCDFENNKTKWYKVCDFCE